MNYAKIKEIAHKFVVWLIVSSADPSKTSLTVKGALLSIIPTMLLFSQMLHLNWSFDSFSQTVEQLTAILTSSLIAIGMLRKVYYLIFTDQNVEKTTGKQL